jgi:hypothetical protein
MVHHSKISRQWQRWVNNCRAIQPRARLLYPQKLPPLLPTRAAAKGQLPPHAPAAKAGIYRRRTVVLIRDLPNGDTIQPLQRLIRAKGQGNRHR